METQPEEENDGQIQSARKAIPDQKSPVMGRLLLYSSIAVTLAATTLGFINNGKLTTTQGELKNLKQTADTTIAQTKKELEKSRGTVKTVTEEKDQALAQAESRKSNLEKSESQVTDLTTKLKDKTDEATKLEAEVIRLQKIIDIPPPKQPCRECAEKQVTIDEKEALITKLQGDLKVLQTQIKEKTARPALKKRNGLEGRILAVNQAWNFVVLNLGDKNGVVGNAEMLIKRGSRLVGKVRVTSVEPSTSIADIVENSVPSGVSIQPGDNVIYQATAE